MWRIMVLMTALIVTACAAGDEQPQAQPVESSSSAKATPTESTSPSSSESSGTVRVTAVDYAFQGVPKTLEAGNVTFAFQNEGKVRHQMYFGLLPDGWSVEEAALGEGNSGTILLDDDILPTAAGKSGKVTLSLDPGRYGYLCSLTAGTRKPHSFLGMLGEFKVK